MTGQKPAKPVHYDDEEAAAILRKAIALQDERSGGVREGLTLEQLKQVALEVGVDPVFVAEAARARTPAASRDRAGRILGGPSSFQYTDEIGAPFDPANAQPLIDEIRRITGRHGRVSYPPTGVEWRSEDGTGGTFVSVHGRGTETHVRVIGVRTEAAIAVYAVGGLAGLVGAVLLGKAIAPMGAEVVVAGAGTVLGTAWLTVRAAWSSISRRLDARLRGLMAEVTHTVIETAAERARQPGADD